ncbi:MAG: histidine triad nucleotide-binding protein [Clostridia bacterium]|nr:histidine triad nucleotide-binding protein [Clostridia bacterium]
MSDCLFCKIIAGEIPGNVVYENDKVFAFRDINPQAPVHVLIVPKRHMDNILACDGETAAALTDAVRVIAGQEGVAQSGFRVISNCGHDGAQSVNHLHVHLLGGRALPERMG